MRGGVERQHFGAKKLPSRRQKPKSKSQITMSEETTFTDVRAHAEQTADDLRILLRESYEALANIGSVASEEVTDLRERLRSAVDGGAVTVGRAAGFARRRLVRAGALVRQNPYTSAGIAVGIALLAGYLVTRSLSRD
jgi:ElaB/YqjD/DUF883 family membrane-anchored ribosome-binding protein